jgi:hypothetical protein
MRPAELDPNVKNPSAPMMEKRAMLMAKDVVTTFK